MPALATPAAPPQTLARKSDPTRPSLELRLPEGRSLAVQVGQVRDQVAEIELARAEGLVLPVGLVAKASLSVTGLGKPLPAHVRVLWRQTTETGRYRYGLSLPALGQRGGALTAALCAAFNRRTCQRVRPEPLAHPLVTLEAGDGLKACGPLNDISLGGLSLQVSAESETDFAAVDDIDVTVHLPSSPAPVRLAARIRSRRLSGNKVRYGIEFEAAGGSRSAVLDYVLSRRDECLRRASRTHAPEQL